MRNPVILLMLVSVSAYAQQAPDWTRDSQRHVEGGDIIQWGTGEAPTREVALFKAKQMAVRALVQECGGIANKEIIPEKQYVEEKLGSFKAFATMSLGLTECIVTRRERLPEGKKSHENPKLAEEQRMYDQLLHGKDDGALESRIRDYVNANVSSHDQEVGYLQNQINQLKTMITQPRAVEEVRMPASDSQKKMCWSEYEQMQNELTQDAAEYGGNMASPELSRNFNKLERKRHLCQRLK